jgi:tetratricopeptide (TPR) repeat protein
MFFAWKKVKAPVFRHKIRAGLWKNKSKRDIVVVEMRRIPLRLLFAVSLAVATVLRVEALPEWQIALRDAVMGYTLSADEIRPLYAQATEGARQSLGGADLDLSLSRSELLMGQALLDEERNEEARPHFAEGLRLAQKAQEAENSAEAWVLMAENISRLCQIGPLGFTMSNGLSVERWAKNALALDPRNAAAQRLIASRWVFAPGILGNPRRGIEMMKAILENGDMGMDDLFNVYSAIGYGYLQIRRSADAKPWLLRALELYPANKFVNKLLVRT